MIRAVGSAYVLILTFRAGYDALTAVGRVTADTLYSCQLIYSFTKMFYPNEFVNSFYYDYLRY